MAHNLATLTTSVAASDRDQWYRDNKSPRLYLKVTPSGARLYYHVRYSSEHGRNIKTKIGSTVDWSTSAARSKAEQINNEFNNPKPPAPKVTTLKELLLLYQQHLVAKGVRHPEYASDNFALSWSQLAQRDISSLTAAELAAEHNKIAGARGKVAAATAIKLLRTLLRYAEDLDLVARNVAKKVRVNGSKPREVWLKPEALKLFFRVLTTMPTDAQDYFKLLLLTAARRSAMASMRWKDIGPETWTIPQESSKNGRVIEVPLVGAAVAILKKRWENRTCDTWVFPSPRSACGHLREPWFWLCEIRAKMGAMQSSTSHLVLPHFTIHDLRRTAATIMTAAGTPITVVAKALGHANVQTTPVYARAGLETVREALEKSATMLLGGSNENHSVIDSDLTGRAD